MSSFVTIYPSDLEYAVSKGTITEKQSALLWPELTSRAEKRFTTTLENLGYASGALLIIGSLTWFTSLAYENKDSLALFYLGLFYVFGFGATGLYFWNKTTTDYSKMVGGIFITIAASVSPVATFALDRYYEWAPTYFYRGSAEAATLIAFSLLALSIANFSPLLIPFNVGVFALVVNTVVPLTYNHIQSVGLFEVGLLGLANVIAGYYTSSQGKTAYSLWFYLFGLLEFCGSLNQEYYMTPQTEYFRIAYFVVHIIIFASALPLNQAIFLLFGGYGICNFIYNQLQLYGNQTVDCSVTTLLGAIICLSAYVVDRRNENSDYPFWGYLFGVGIVEGASTWLFALTYHNSWTVGLVYFFFNIGLTLLYIPTQRWQFVMGGVTGVLCYTNWLLNTYASSYALPLMITLVGLTLIAFAVWLGRSKIVAKTRRFRGLPQQDGDQEAML